MHTHAVSTLERLLSILTYIGAPLRAVPPQHGGVHPCQGARAQEPAHHPQAGPADVGAAAVRAEPQEGARDGAADQDQAGPEGVRLQGRRRVSKVRYCY